MSADVGSSIRAIFKGGSVLVLGFFLEMGISFLAKLVMARELGRIDYGAVSVGLAAFGILSSVVVLGLNAGVGRYIPRRDDDEWASSVIRTAYQLVLPLAVLVGAGLFALADPVAVQVFRDSSVAPILRVFAVAIPLAAFVKLSIGVVQGMQHTFPKVVIQNVTLPSVRFVGVVVAIVLGYGAFGVAGAYLVSYAVAAAIGLVYLLGRTPVLLRAGHPPVRRELLSFSLPLFIAGLAGIVFADLDMLLLGALSTTGDVGVYNVVYPLAQLVSVGLSSFAFIFMPVFSELHAAEAHDQMRRVYQVVTKWIFFGTLPVVVVMAGFPAATIWLTFGGEYLPGSVALSILVLGFFTHAVIGPNANALTALGRTRFLLAVNVGAAIANVVLNLLLIPPFSFLGAAVATAVTYAGMNVVLSWRLYREYDIVPFTSALVRPGVVAIGLAVFITVLTRRYLEPTPLVFVGLFVGYLAAYSTIVIRLGGIEQEEVMLLLSIEDRFDVDLGPLKRIARMLMK